KSSHPRIHTSQRIESYDIPKEYVFTPQLGNDGLRSGPVPKANNAVQAPRAKKAATKKTSVKKTAINKAVVKTPTPRGAKKKAAAKIPTTAKVPTTAAAAPKRTATAQAPTQERGCDPTTWVLSSYSWRNRFLKSILPVDGLSVLVTSLVGLIRLLGAVPSRSARSTKYRSPAVSLCR